MCAVSGVSNVIIFKAFNVQEAISERNLCFWLEGAM